MASTARSGAAQMSRMLLITRSKTRLTAVRTGEFSPSPMARSLGRTSAIGMRRSTRSANLCAGTAFALLGEGPGRGEPLAAARRDLLRLGEIHRRIELAGDLVLAICLTADDALDLGGALSGPNHQHAVVAPFVQPRHQRRPG